MAKIAIDTCYCVYLLEAPEEIVLHISEYIQKYILNGEGLGDGHQYFNKNTQDMMYEVEDIRNIGENGFYKYPMVFLD